MHRIFKGHFLKARNNELGAEKDGKSLNTLFSYITFQYLLIVLFVILNKLNWWKLCLGWGSKNYIWSELIPKRPQEFFWTV